jgi:lipopolysaccharide/colanic/teichoic acid biosynthesis glycosyltransferase
MYSACKRVLDVALAALGIALSAPLWAGITVAVRLSSDGPILYAGPRIGKNGVLFSMYKFRTMWRNADRLGPAVTAADDPRITSIGRWLRATKVDELPQLLNVLRGEMSLVGPRPEAPEYVAHYDDRQRRVLSVRPGITGPTQLAYRHEEQLLRHSGVVDVYLRELMPRKLEMDLLYVERRNLWLDVRLLVSTLCRLLPLGGRKWVSPLAPENTSFGR